ncbi:MAG: hypothetical protein INR71_00790, partial [Terriglobus roseus]|nr:hypothetical protein [Terriglobus roseus]
MRRTFEGATTAAGAAKKLEAEEAGGFMTIVRRNDPPGLLPGEVRPPLPPEPNEPVRRASWMKQAKDRLKARSSSRGRGGGGSS